MTKPFTQQDHIPNWRLKCYGGCADISPDTIADWRDSWTWGQPAPMPVSDCPCCGEDMRDPSDG